MTDSELLDAIKQAVKAEIAPLEARLTSLEQTVADRLRDTKPIWEQALKEIVEAREEARVGFRKLDTRLKSLTIEVAETRADLRDHEQRLQRLEDASAPTER